MPRGAVEAEAEAPCAQTKPPNSGLTGNVAEQKAAQAGVAGAVEAEYWTEGEKVTAEGANQALMEEAAGVAAGAAR